MTVETPRTSDDAAAPAGGFSDDNRQVSTLAEAARDYVNRLRGGDMGSLPAIFGLVVLFSIFTAVDDSGVFLSRINMANLIVQAAAICVLAMGLVFVLLLGEIDLSAGVAGGAAATITCWAMFEHGWTWWLATLAAIGTGVLIGLVIGLLVAVLQIPSFVVTLAFFLGLQAVPLWIIGRGGSLPMDGLLRDISIKNVPVTAGWIAAVAIVLGYTGLALFRYRRQVDRGLAHKPLALVLLRIAVLAAIVLGGVALLSANRGRSEAFVIAGIPWVLPIVVALLMFWTFVLGRTRFGRYLYAIGGNAEAARRAGIKVVRMRVAAFVICSSMAAISGLLAASNTGSVSPGAGGGNELLYAVGAAVIGGTSLFGGRGRAVDGVVGGFVIATIPNGMLLLDQPSYINFLVTGAVLLVAASVDAISRRRRSSAGV